VRADLPGGQPLGIPRQHHLIDPAQPPLPRADDLRLERARPVPGHLDANRAAALGQHRLGPGAVAHVAGLVARLGMLAMTEVPGHLLTDSRFQDRLGQLLEQPI